MGAVNRSFSLGPPCNWKGFPRSATPAMRHPGRHAHRLASFDPVAHYAEAFYVEPGTCFRFRHNGVGHAVHRREPVVAKGQFIDGSGKRWWFDACEEHADELSGTVVWRTARPCWTLPPNAQRASPPLCP